MNRAAKPFLSVFIWKQISTALSFVHAPAGPNFGRGLPFPWGGLCGLLCFVAFATPSGARADACSDCRAEKRISCSNRCDSSPDRKQYDNCIKDCVIPLCDVKCKASPNPDNSFESPQEKCRSCLMKKLAEGCPDKCDRASPGYERCRKSCAKQRCAQQCSLPDAGFHDAPAPAKYACEQCKTSADMTCRASSACKPGHPGSIACQFHCVAEACKSICNEEAQELEQ